jgi:secreted trypsin-like serine protease
MKLGRSTLVPFLCLLASSAYLLVTAQDDGTPKKLDPKIIGGTPVEEGTYPFYCVQADLSCGCRYVVLRRCL